MAETKKPASTRKPVKRGPTKAAALKALGITQEDLDTIKKVAAARELAEKTEAQQQAKQETYEALAERNEPVPADVQTEAKVVNPNAPKYVRNLRHVEVGFRLERQQGPGKKRTELKPRGQRGDLTKLQPGDEADANLQTQVAYDVVEIITAEEAQAIISKQSTNAQQAVHPALAMLRNPSGQEYGPNGFQGVREQESYTVAHLDPAQMQGRVDDRAVARGNPVVRVTETQVGPIGTGPIVDFTPPTAQVQDQIARQKGENAPQGPAAGLAPGVQVTVDPVQRT